MPAADHEPLHCEQCGAALENSTSSLGCINCLRLAALGDPEIETRRFQHYEVCLRPDESLDELGRGAMGITYRALDTNLDSLVALKIISARYSGDPGARGRFQREARAAAQLRHPNVASVFHFGETEDGQCFYAMELVEGETLEARVHRDGPLPPALALDVAIQVARALIAAEAQELVHRDLKPSNLMVLANPSSEPDELVVKVIDFGLAKAIAPTPEEAAGVAASFSGTPDFASPEQFGGSNRPLDVRSDIYSLGATLWYLLSGRAPFAGRSSPTAGSEAVAPPLPLQDLATAKVPAPILALLRSMLAADPAARPQSARELLTALRSCRAAIESRPRRWKLLALAGLALVVAVGLTIHYSHRTPALSVPDKSVAVLPFENLSNEKENAYFAGGVQGEVLARLARISDLKVISRTSVTQYRSGAARNLREIGRSLGVANVVEGSVQRSGNRMRVVAQLIDARTDAHLWGETYDRDLTDIFSVESDVAKSIADSLQARLTGPERKAVEAEPTQNPAAYDAYLRARQLQTNPDTLLRDFKIAEQLYARAVSLDPKFALAHARLAQTNAEIFHFYDRTEPWKSKAKAEAEMALRLQPDLPEGHHALGLYFYWVTGDYDRALQEFTEAIRLAPGSTESPFLIAAIRRRQGRWDETLAAYNHLAALDPQNPNIVRNLVYTNTAVRDWPKAARAARRWLAIAADSVTAKVQAAYIDFWWHGSTAALKTELATIPAGVDPDGMVTATRWDVSMIERDYSSAEHTLQSCPLDEVSYLKIQPTPKSFLLGTLALARGDTVAAQTSLADAREKLEAAVEQAPTNAERHANLGLLYALLDRRDEAIREGLRAVELKPETKDALDGTVMNCYLALIYARSGKPDLALPLLERLLRTPGAVDSADYSVTRNDLKFRWEWDPLRGDPRFQRLLADKAPH